MSFDILTIDTKGLSQIKSRNGLNWLVAELIQNAWDQRVKRVDMTIESVGHGKGRVTVIDDDPQGFLDLTHSYTLFAESNKKGDATLRGRFNLGEKFVIAYCVETGGSVEILTTSGGYHFSKKDGRKRLRRKTETGSKVTAEFRASKKTLAQMIEYVQTFIAPSDFPTTINGEELQKKNPLAEFDELMPTVSVNDEGEFFKTTRKTTIEVIEAIDGEQPMIYELGIPVVENPTKYHINVQQKIPLNMERDAVTPAYSRKVCAVVLNATRDFLSKEEVCQPWIAEAMESDEIEAESVIKVLDSIHGEKRVMFDPNNPSSSTGAIAAGYTVVYGGNHSKKAHENIRKHDPIISATEKMKDEGGMDLYSHRENWVDVIEQLINDAEKMKGKEIGKDLMIRFENWTDAMKILAEYTSELHEITHGSPIDVVWVNDSRNYGTYYGEKAILLNKRRLGTKWIMKATSTLEGFTHFLDLMIHEFSKNFDKGPSRIGAFLSVYFAKSGLPKWLLNKDNL